VSRVVLSPWVAVSHGLPATAVYAVGSVVLVVAVAVAAVLGRRSGRRALAQRLTALGSRLGIDSPDEGTNVESSLAYLEQVTGAAAEAVADSSADAIRLRRALDTFPQGVVLCDENGNVVYRNARANALMTSRHGEALAAQAVTELLEDAWDNGSAERTLDLYGPPRRTLSVRARQIDDGRRPLGVVAIIEDVSERRRLEDIRRDFVANVSHELKTPMGALGLLAETLVAEPDIDVARRLANRIHTEAFRVSRIIDDLLDLSRIESEEAPPREPVLVNLFMAEAAERVRASAEQRGIAISLVEPDPPVAVLGDRRQLVSAMHALIENAVTYSYDGSTVSVAARIVRGGEEVPELADSAGNAAVAPPAARTSAPLGSNRAAHEPHGSPGAGSAPVPPAPAWTAGEAPSVVQVPPGGPPAGHAAAPSTSPAPVPPPDPGSELRNEAGGAAANGAANGSADAESSFRTPVAPAASTPGPGAAPAAATSTAGNGARPQEPTTRRSPRDTVRISVVDHGIGIPARDLERIFERFYRVDQGRSRHTGGTGLGLSIVRHVASNHQGWVEVESREGEGSTFTLVLPLHPDRS
jgi:two-component system sensor histidine kinase SenX3